MYIAVAAALLSGIFTPLTIGTDLQDVILGMWSLFVGVGGGIVIFLGIQNQKFRTRLLVFCLVLFVAGLAYGMQRSIEERRCLFGSAVEGCDLPVES